MRPSMRKLTTIFAVLLMTTVSADDVTPKASDDKGVKATPPKVAPPHVLTVKERLARLEFIDVTSEKKPIENENTQLEPELEAILEEAKLAEEED